MPKITEKYIKFEEIEEKIPKTHFEDSSRGWCHVHPNMDTRFNPTCAPGTAIGVIFGLIAQMINRWDFTVHKVDEWTEISTSHPYYQTITRQKHDLIRQIKESLAQVGRAVSDVELLEHDARKYREMLKYFEEEDEHSLKAMFIDQVDVNLPEGVSLRSIAPRWPTIIVDFQELTDEDDNPDKIKDKLKISKAEAVILSTKVRLYKKWKGFFKENVVGRFRAIKIRLEARKKSIDEYADWARPLIRRVQQMKEVSDSFLMTSTHIPVGIGTPVSVQYLEYWAWTKAEGVEPAEMHKRARVKYPKGGEAKVRFLIEPYDYLVKKLIPRLEKIHGVPVTKKDILEARKRLYEEGSPGADWYVLIKIPVSILTVRLASGAEFEDIDFNRLQAYFLTPNAMLVKILELVLEEKKFDTHIDELLGKKVIVEGKIKEIEDLLREDFPKMYPAKEKEKQKSEFMKPVSSFKSSITKIFSQVVTGLNNIFGLKLGFIKLGPYDPAMRDRLAYIYGRPFALDVWGGTIWAYLMKKFGVI